MRLQFTIRRLLFATAAFALVLGLCAPFDSPAVVFGIPTTCAAFVFVLIFKSQGESENGKTSSSRRQAILAGMMRGAKFGAKWMAIFTATWILALGIVVAAMLLDLWLRQGKAIQFHSEMLTMSVMVILVFVVLPTFLATVLGALIMGIGGGVGYRHRSAEADVEARTE